MVYVFHHTGNLRKKWAPEDGLSGMKCGTPAIGFNFRCETSALKRIIRYSEQCR